MTKVLDFAKFVKNTWSEMAMHNRFPDVATPLDDTFISFIYHVPPEVRRLAEIWFWQKGFWEASHRRDFLAKNKGVKNPEKIKTGITPYYVDFPFKGGIIRVLLKDPKTGKSVVRNWSDPSKTIDVYENLFSMMEDKLGRKGITGTDPDDPTTNKPGHDLSGAKSRIQHAAYNQKLGQYTRHGEYPPGHPKAGQPLPAHAPEEEELVLPNLGLPVIQTTDDKTTAMRAMATKKVRNELEKEVEEKLQMVNFDPTKLKVFNPETGKVEPAKIGKANIQKKEFEGMERNFNHAKKLQTAEAEVDWESMKKMGWKPLYRPTYNEQENSFTAVRWNKGRLEQMNLRADPKTGQYYRTFASEYAIKNMNVNPQTGAVQHIEYKKDPKGRPVKSAKQIEPQMVPFIIPLNQGGPLPTVEKPAEFGGRSDGYKAYGGMYLNKDDPTQMKWPAHIQNSLEDLWIKEPELFGDDRFYSKEGGDVVTSIFNGFKKSDSGNSKKDYYDVFKYVANNMRDPSFWMGRDYQEDSPEYQKMADYVKGLVNFATRKTNQPPQMDADIEKLLKSGANWRQGKAASKTYYANLGGREKALSSLGDDGDSQNIADMKAIVHADPSKIAAAKELGEELPPEEKVGMVSSKATDLEKIRRKKLGLDANKAENPDIFKAEEKPEVAAAQSMTKGIEQQLNNKVYLMANQAYQPVLKSNNAQEFLAAATNFTKQIEPYVLLASSTEKHKLIPVLLKLAKSTADSNLENTVSKIAGLTEADFIHAIAGIRNSVSEAFKKFVDYASEANPKFWTVLMKDAKVATFANMLNAVTNNYASNKTGVKIIPMNQPKIIPMNQPNTGIAKAEHTMSFTEWFEERKKLFNE